MEAAQLAHVDQADAKQLLQSKLSTVSTADMSSLSQQLASFDRECCGRIASSELAEALQNSNLELSNAEVLRVANGLSDCHGLLTYRPIASMLQRCGSTHKKSDNLQAQSVAAARMSASTEKKSADVATARADKQQQSEQNSSVDVQSQGATTVKTSRPPLTPRQTLLQSRLGNRAQQHASQPCINRVLVAASVSDTSMDAEGANAAQQRQDWGQSTEAQMLGSEQQTGRQPRSAVVLEGQIRQEPRASASSQALASAASAKQASGFAARVRPAPAKTPYWFSKGMIGAFCLKKGCSHNKDVSRLFNKTCSFETPLSYTMRGYSPFGLWKALDLSQCATCCLSASFGWRPTTPSNICLPISSHTFLPLDPACCCCIQVT